MSRGHERGAGVKQSVVDMQASCAAVNGQGRGVLKFTRLDENETHATSGRTSGEVLGILGSTMLDPEGLAREKV